MVVLSYPCAYHALVSPAQPAQAKAISHDIEWSRATHVDPREIRHGTLASKCDSLCPSIVSRGGEDVLTLVDWSGLRRFLIGRLPAGVQPCRRLLIAQRRMSRLLAGAGHLPPIVRIDQVARERLTIRAQDARHTKIKQSAARSPGNPGRGSSFELARGGQDLPLRPVINRGADRDRRRPWLIGLVKTGGQGPRCEMADRSDQR